MPRRRSAVSKSDLAKAIALVKESHGAAEVVFGADGSVRVTPAKSAGPVDFKGEVRL